MISKADARKVSLRKQEEYRKQGKDSAWCARYSAAFWRTDAQLRGDK